MKVKTQVKGGPSTSPCPACNSDYNEKKLPYTIKLRLIDLNL